jgi:thiol-disulfide isomerase/thioredoxin
MKRIPTLLFCAGLALTALVAQQALRRAPGFALPDGVTGQIRDLYDYRGKTVVLEFMKTTCPHCAAFADIISEVNQKYAGRVQVISVVNTGDDNPTSVKQYVTGHKVSYPVLFDMGQMEYSYIQKPSVDLPHVYVIDANGYIHADYGYSLTTRDIFEGKGLFTEIDRTLGAVNSSKK